MDAYGRKFPQTTAAALSLSLLSQEACRGVNTDRTRGHLCAVLRRCLVGECRHVRLYGVLELIVVGRRGDFTWLGYVVR